MCSKRRAENYLADTLGVPVPKVSKYIYIVIIYARILCIRKSRAGLSYPAVNTVAAVRKYIIAQVITSTCMPSLCLRGEDYLVSI